MKIALKIVMAVLLIAPSFQLTQASSDCGNWADVPTRDYSEHGGTYNYNEILTTVCEYGLMKGYSSSEYGFDEELSRAEAATIVNRLYFGSDEYDDMEVDLDYAWSELNEDFDDMPSNHSNNEWILKAMYYANENDFMNGDKGAETFRPYDGINIVETWKIFYEASYASGIIADDADDNITYSMDPWWYDLMETLEDEGVFTHFDEENQQFWLTNPMLTPYSDFGTEINREDAAIFLASLIEKGYIDEEKLADHVDDPEHGLGDDTQACIVDGYAYQEGDTIDFGTYTCSCYDGEVKYCTGENS